jgi:hypothetical protein
MPDPALILRRASVSRKDGSWQDEDYDVFDGEQCVLSRYVACVPSQARFADQLVICSGRLIIGSISRSTK